MKAKVLTSILVFSSLLSASWFAHEKYVHPSVETQDPLDREQLEMLYINSPTARNTGENVGQVNSTRTRFKAFGPREYVRIKNDNPDILLQDPIDGRSEESQELWYFE